MQLGMVGLGRMGSNMVRRLMRSGHECIVYDVSEAAVDSARVAGGNLVFVTRGSRGEALAAEGNLDDGARSRDRFDRGSAGWPRRG